MRDTNAQTEHSRELRKKTAAERRQRILLEGGSDFRALIEHEHVLKLEAVLKWQQMGGRNNVTKTSVFRQMIDDAYHGIPDKFKEDQAAYELAHLESQKLTKYFETISHMENTNKSKLNHSKNPEIIAIDLNEVKRAADSHGLSLPSIIEMKPLLKTANSYLKSNHPVASRLTGRTKKCWVFQVNTTP